MTSYLIKSILCSGILIMVYHLFLEREKMLHFNRFYLLAALIFSLVVPLISFEVKPETAIEPVVRAVPEVIAQMQIAPVMNPVTAASKNISSFNLATFIPFLFYISALLLFIRYVLNIRAILKLKERCKVIPLQDAKLILVPQDIITYTFLNNIFVPEKAFENDQIRDEILTHELTHARQMHSADILFIELVQVLMWINPFVFFYKKAIRLNHEFLADEAVLGEYANIRSYQLLLLDTISQGKQVNLTSSFNYSITKKRLAMMTRIKNLNRHYAKQAAIGLLAFVLTFTFSEKIYSQIEKKAAKALPEVAKPSLEAGVGLSQEEMAEFKNTIEKHTTYVINKKGRTDPMVNMDPKLEDRMHALFVKMSPEQNEAVRKSGIMVYQLPIPVKKAPTEKMFENWKIPTIFGVWINDKHVPNTELNKYKSTDIAEYSLSKLYGGALKGRIYKYQLDLRTNEYFDKTYDQRVNDRVFIARVGWIGAKPKEK